ncbi:MFS transporter [Plantactinospora sonchi]|uniref:MFS transporter n=1 Tax=Plantactinospora sonchi TaxID=1544735 RepID=A0ABU7S170_9ACTN
MIPPGNPELARPPVGRPLWSLVGPALGALLAAGLLTAPIGPLAGAITRDLGLSTTTMLMTVVVPYVVAAAALVVPGHLLGRRWPTATAVPASMLLVLGSAVSAFTPGVALLAVGRVVLGVGAGTVVGVVLALSGQLGHWRSRARLVLGLGLGVALLVGPVVSGTLTVALGWRLAFVADLLMATVALVGAVVGGIGMWILRAVRPSGPAAPVTTPPLPDETSLGGPAR